MKNSMKVFCLMFAVSLCLGSCGGRVSESGTSGTRDATGEVALHQTGQGLCYSQAGVSISCAGTGQDGEKQAGAGWPSQRFSINADTTITDRLTGLVWLSSGNIMLTRDSGWDQDGANDGAVAWQHALDYVSKLNSENYLGHNDWRLPNRSELRSLSNYGMADSSVWLNAQGFSNVQASYYWSSSTDAEVASLAWMNGMIAGEVTSVNKSFSCHVWPVRSAAAARIELPKTGQVWCYDNAGDMLSSCIGSGQDGEKQIGVPWPSQRFTNNADMTILDRLTGLVWATDAGTPTVTGTTSICSGSSMLWQEALTYVACLNTNNYLGHNDWRLPNVSELESLIHTGFAQETCGGAPCTNSAAWLNTQGFSNVQIHLYWSSTSYVGRTTDAWFAGMKNGLVTVANKGGSFYVWPVRGRGQ